MLEEDIEGTVDLIMGREGRRTFTFTSSSGPKDKECSITFLYK